MSPAEAMHEPTSPAEELRAAAKLMRERVQGATAGPWIVREEHGRDIADEGWSDVRVVRPGAAVAITYLSNVLEGSPHEDNAAYIASMHPGVALAVADWLDESGAWFERDVAWESPEGPCCAEPAACGGHEPIWYHADCDGEVATDCHCFDKALTVARAYLGSGQ